MKNTFYLKFMEKNNQNYEKIKKILSELNLKIGDILYFDDINMHVNEFLDQYSLLERQILLKNLISENCPQVDFSFEIFTKSTQIVKKGYVTNKTTLDVLDLIENSDGYFHLYK